MILIVSRHPAGIAFAREYAYEKFGTECGQLLLTGNVVEDDVRGQVVVGNLPLHLAAVAKEVHAIEFDGNPPRGTEYTVEDMRAAGARISVYTVFKCLEGTYLNLAGETCKVTCNGTQCRYTDPCLYGTSCTVRAAHQLPELLADLKQEQEYIAGLDPDKPTTKRVIENRKVWQNMLNKEIERCREILQRS